MKVNKRPTKISVPATVYIDEICLDNDEAMALILTVDAAQQDSGFTEDLIANLVKSMLKEYKGFPEEMESFKNTIMGMFK